MKQAFFSVQSAVDGARLRSGGDPWPTGLQRANLGVGLYAWESLECAERYRTQLERHGAKDLQVLTLQIDEQDLQRIAKLDLTTMMDDQVSIWMEEHSLYGKGLPHQYQFVVRQTQIGKEHYFAAAIFGLFEEAP